MIVLRTAPTVYEYRTVMYLRASRVIIEMYQRHSVLNYTQWYIIQNTRVSPIAVSFSWIEQNCDRWTLCRIKREGQNGHVPIILIVFFMAGGYDDCLLIPKRGKVSAKFCPERWIHSPKSGWCSFSAHFFWKNDFFPLFPFCQRIKAYSVHGGCF
jgi:hypothetical protein